MLEHDLANSILLDHFEGMPQHVVDDEGLPAACDSHEVDDRLGAKELDVGLVDSEVESQTRYLTIVKYLHG